MGRKPFVALGIAILAMAMHSITFGDRGLTILFIAAALLVMSLGRRQPAGDEL